MGRGRGEQAESYVWLVNLAQRGVRTHALPERRHAGKGAHHARVLLNQVAPLHRRRFQGEVEGNDDDQRDPTRGDQEGTAAGSTVTMLRKPAVPNHGWISFDCQGISFSTTCFC